MSKVDQGVSTSSTALSPSGSSSAISPASLLQSTDADGQRAFLNCVRSLFNIDGYLLPESTAEQQGQFIRDPVRYFISTDKRQQDAIWREVSKRQVRA